MLAKPPPPTGTGGGLTAFESREHHVGLGKAVRDRQCLQHPRVTHCVPLKGFFFLALVSSTEGWMEWALQLHRCSEPHGMETSNHHIVLCGSGPGLWIWVACLQKGVTSQGTSLPQLLVSGERTASLEK